MNDRETAFGKFNLLQKDLAKLFVQFSSHRESLNKIIGGYKIETDFASMDLEEADSLIDSMKEVQAKIKTAERELNYYKNTYGFEE